MRTLLLLVVLAGSMAAQPQGIQRGTFKKVDLEKKLVTVTVDGIERVLRITDETRVFGAEGKKLAERFTGIKDGEAIMFLPLHTENGDQLVALRTEANFKAGLLPKVDLTKLKPLPELGKNEYQGFAGGLYPDGANQRPDAHEQAGLKLAKEVQPLDATGKPDPNGKIVILSLGMSNTSQASTGFMQHLRNDETKNPAVQFVNGAQGGMTAKAIQDPKDNGTGTRYWNTVDERLTNLKVTAAQVQVIWIKQADAGPTQGFPKYAQTLQEELKRIVELLPQRYPNAKLVYLSSRTFGGYATTPLNPEPYAYESGFAVKWLIEDYLKGNVKSPWLSWGPYLWANGTTKNASGLAYEKSDFAADGTHPSAAGQSKVGKELLQFFRTDSTTKSWFVKQP